MGWLLAFLMIGLASACTIPAQDPPSSPWTVSYERCAKMQNAEKQRTCLEDLNARQQLVRGLTKADEDANLQKFYSTILTDPDPEQDLLIPPVSSDEKKPVILDADQ